MTRALGIVCLGLALAATAAGASGEELVRVITPADGAELLAGAETELAWEPGPALAGSPDLEEWEAFLSLDGGRTFPVRLTPHLDLNLQRARIRVPEVASEDVALLLRVGDDRVEREVRVPGRWAIRAAVRTAPLPALVPALGEAARRGDAGVVAWVEGARDGSGWREVATSLPQASLGSRLHPGLAPWLFASGPRVERQLPSPPTATPLAAPADSLLSAAPSSAATPRSRSILLLLSRRNE